MSLNLFRSLMPAGEAFTALFCQFADHIPCITTADAQLVRSQHGCDTSAVHSFQEDPDIVIRTHEPWFLTGDTGRREIDGVLASVEVCPREHCIGGHGLREEEALQLIAPKL